MSIEEATLSNMWEMTPIDGRLLRKGDTARLAKGMIA